MAHFYEQQDDLGERGEVIDDEDDVEEDDDVDEDDIEDDDGELA